MQNAALCIPYDYTVGFHAPAVPGTLPEYIANDEPGLVYEANGTIDGARAGFNIDLGSSKTVRFAAILGLMQRSYDVTIEASDAADFSAIAYSGTFRSNFSTSRSSDLMKTFAKIPDVSARYWSVRFPPTVPGNYTRFWRFLIGDVIQPVENITVGAEDGIDDRSTRRYTRTGRRVIDPTVIVPTFQGEWPWLEDFEYMAMRKWWRTQGASKPAMLVLDTQMDTDSPYGGEDGIFYGDFEKSGKFTIDEGCYGFSFAVVSIAP